MRALPGFDIGDLQQVVRVGGIVILARMLRPDDFGVFRMLMVVAMYLVSMSLGTYLDPRTRLKVLVQRSST